MKLLLAIAAGGSVGALARHFLILHIGQWTGHGFPWGTVAVNISGSFALGCLAEIMALAWSPSAEIRAFLVVGLLGSFTTFSLFSLDVAAMLQRGALLPAGLYTGLSVLLSVLGFFAGLALFRQILA